jgi:hypothetical protein
VVFAGLAFSGALVLMVLPNTKGVALHESLASAGTAATTNKEEPARPLAARQRRADGTALPVASTTRQQGGEGHGRQ